MKTFLTISSFLLICSFAMAQKAIPFKGKVITYSPIEAKEPSNSSVHKTSPNTGGGTGMSTQSVSFLHSLPNAYGYATAIGQKQLTTYPELNSIAFCNRVNPAVIGGGTTSDLIYSISTNAGNSWLTSPLVINVNSTGNGYPRYPNSVLFRNGGTGLTDLKLHVVSPTLTATTGGTWDGILEATVQDVANTNSAYTSQEDYNYQNIDAFQAFSMTERVHNSGEFWMVCNSISAGNDSLYVFKGNYDATVQKINWALNDAILPTWNTAYDGAAHHTTPRLAFSPNGTTGYLAILGDIVGGRDSSYMPIVWSFNGTHFVNETEVDLNVPSLNNYVLQWQDSLGVPIAAATGGKVTTAFDFDLTVDILGHPHIMTIVGPAAVDMNSMPYVISSGFGMREMDITWDNNTWSSMEIARQMTFREVLGTAPDALQIDASPMISRSLDGRYIFYTWTDTDVTGIGGNDNTQPDLWGMMLDVTLGLVTDSINWTVNDPSWHKKARAAKTSEYVLETPSSSTCGTTLTVPTTIFDPHDLTDMLTTCDVYYVSDISYPCESAVNVAKLTGFFAGIQHPSSLQNLRVYPNPAHNQFIVQLQMPQLDDVNMVLYNTTGQKIWTKSLQNTTDIKETVNSTALSSGIYFLQVSNSTSTKTEKIVIE